MAQKRVITKEKGDTLAGISKAEIELRVLIASENPDITKWKIEEVAARIKAIETILQIRR
jgi:hypothetical protein